MAETKIVTKNSVTIGDTPSNLLEGELAVNIPDRRIFVGPVNNGAGVALNDADGITYNNSASGLSATNIQTAIDELDANVDAKPDQSDVDEKANTADLGALAYEADAPADGNDYVRKDNAWSQLVITPYQNPYGFLFGEIGSNGDVVSGTSSGGFTPSRIGTGEYQITFDTAINTNYTVVVGPVFDTLNNMPWLVSQSSTNFVVHVRYGGDDPGIKRNNSFSFHLIYLVP